MKKPYFDTSPFRTLAIIPARKNSNRLKDKNIKPLCGKPVIEYTIDYASSCAILHDVVVTSDDLRVISLAISKGVTAILRPEELAEDNTRIDLVLKHTVKHLEKGGESANIIVLLYACVPIREEGLIERGVKLLLEGGGDSVASFAPIPKRYSVEMYLGNWGISQKFHMEQLSQRFFHDGGIIIVRRESLFNPEGGNFGWLGKKCLPLLVEEEAVDIDTEEDFKRAEAILCSNV